jgi:hypothetical protein|tara:strand:+ start:709 stop:1053 length:345 start_codon:yes stop_codon:yes gene_type:complete
MSLGEQIANRRIKEKRTIEVPEWGEDNTPLILYASAITAGDINKLQRKHKNFLNDMTVDGMVDLIIEKAELEDGKKAFSLSDKPFLMSEKVNIIAEVSAKMFGETVSVEEQEKN